jgi:transcriptional regulator with PAS, ATPase and Fis domain
MRVIAASNIPLKELVHQGHMRRDFYYRINVIPIHLIPLRQRREDIPLLVQDFLHHHPIAIQKKIAGLCSEAMDQLMKYSWPGNIRELQNVLEKAIVLTKSRVIEEVDLTETVPDLIADPQQKITTNLPLLEWIREQEKHYLMQKLETFGGRIDLTAKSSGVDVRTIYRKMRLYGLDKKVFSRRAAKSAFPLITNPAPDTDH